MDKELIEIWLKLKAVIEGATVGSSSLKNKLGLATKEFIIKRTKAGKSVVKRQEETQRELKEKTIEVRRSLQKNGKLAADTTPEKSNMTRSGELLNDIQHENTINGTNVKIGSLKNRRKARHQPSGPNGREIMLLTKEEEDKLALIVAESIVSALKKNF